MTKEKRYDNVPHRDLIVQDGTIKVQSIFQFKGGCQELFPFLAACKGYNCTVIFENENFTVTPEEGKGTPDIILSLYATCAENQQLCNDYIRFLGKCSEGRYCIDGVTEVQ